MLIISWYFIALILSFIAILFSPLLISKKKKLLLCLLGTICFFNTYAIINIINSLRRDYSYDLLIFPIYIFIIYLIVFNGIFLLLSLLFYLKLDNFNQTQIGQKIKKFFLVLKNNIFKTDKIQDIIISLLILFVLHYGITLIITFFHEFGHATAMVLCNMYFDRIKFRISTYGMTYWGMGVTLNDIQRVIVSSGGIFSDIFISGIILIIFQMKVMEKGKFNRLMTITIYIRALFGGVGYFIFPLLVNFKSDSGDIAKQLNILPINIFLVFLPLFILITVVFIFITYRYYKKEFKPSKKFIIIYFLSYTLFMVYYFIFLMIETYILPGVFDIITIY